MGKYNCTPVLIDWLSISGKTKGFQFEKFKCIKLDYGTSVFSRLEEIYYKTERIASVSSVPYSDIIHKDLHIVKLDNWVLYSDEFITIYSDLITELRLKNVALSRIDICRDFNYFFNKRDPSNLIRGFLSGKLIKLGKSKYSVWGETDRYLTYDYLSFGKKSGNINIYLYNKSKELLQVKNKPHIVNKWNQFDLDLKRPSYRLEISIKMKGISLINKNTGENKIFDIEHIFLQDKLEELYTVLLSKYFHFKTYTGQKNISREISVILFDQMEFDEIIWEADKSLESNRSDKIFLKKLDTMYSELRSDDFALFESIEKLREVFSYRKNLTSYLSERITPNTLMMLAHPGYFEPEMKKLALEVADSIQMFDE